MTRDDYYFAAFLLYPLVCLALRSWGLRNKGGER